MEGVLGAYLGSTHLTWESVISPEPEGSMQRTSGVSKEVLTKRRPSLKTGLGTTE